MKARKTVAGMAADPTIRAAKLDLNGVIYFLVFDFNAIAEAEAAAPGLNLLQALDLQGLNAGQFRGLFYASLSKLQPKITIEEAGALVGFNTIAKISDALLEAWTLSMPQKETEDENPPKPDLAPAGQ